MSIGVYKITNIINGKFYIGSSKNIENRLKDHFKSLESNTHYNSHLQNAYNKYGKDAFISEIIEITDLDNLRDREDYYIKSTKCYDRTIGYNIAKGAVCGPDYLPEETIQKLRRPKSEEAKQHLRETFARIGHSKGEKNPNYGKHWSKEWREAQSKRLKNNEKLAKAKRFLGKTHTDISKSKTSISLKNTHCIKSLQLPSELLINDSWTFATNNKSKRTINTSIINADDVNTFFENCHILNKHGAYIASYSDNTNTYILDEQTFLKMKEALEQQNE